jgi:hypothetical protein
MTLIDEVLEFSREYINSRYKRTPERKIKIAEALKILTGERVRRSCRTCYIEALIKIRNIMATANYELKKGYVASFDNGAYKGIKSFTNDQVTDELAAEYLRQFPSRVVYFVRLPGTVKIINPAAVRIIPPAQKAEVIEPELQTINDVHSEITGAKKTVKKTSKSKK